VPLSEYVNKKQRICGFGQHHLWILSTLRPKEEGKNFRKWFENFWERNFGNKGAKFEKEPPPPEKDERKSESGAQNSTGRQSE
jgi:hypothetical protein